MTDPCKIVVVFLFCFASSRYAHTERLAGVLLPHSLCERGDPRHLGRVQEAVRESYPAGPGRGRQRGRPSQGGGEAGGDGGHRQQVDITLCFLLLTERPVLIYRRTMVDFLTWGKISELLNDEKMYIYNYSHKTVARYLNMKI